jgi:hypothetical protein
MKTELDKFYDLIDDIRIAMMTTRRPDGQLSNPALWPTRSAPTARTCGL